VCLCVSLFVTAALISAGVCVRCERMKAVWVTGTQLRQGRKKLISLLQLEPRRLGSLALTPHALALSPLQIGFLQNSRCQWTIRRTKARVLLASHVGKKPAPPRRVKHTVSAAHQGCLELRNISVLPEQRCFSSQDKMFKMSLSFQQSH